VKRSSSAVPTGIDSGVKKVLPSQSVAIMKTAEKKEKRKRKVIAFPKEGFK
jgi:hypothetical protein